MKNSIYMDMEEVKKVLGISERGAYRLIQQMNEEMQNKGFLALRGRVNRKYFEDRMYLNKDNADFSQKGED